VAFAFWVTYQFAHTTTGPHHNQFDLKIYYRAVTFWIDGNNIYDYSQPDPVNITLGFTYPPLAAVLMAPMAGLSLSLLTTISVLAIIATTAWCVFVCLRERVRITRQNGLMVVGLATAASFLLEPIRQTMGFGQINMYLMALVLLDVLVLGRRGSRWTGIGIGLAMAIKLTPGIFLLYLLLSKQWRATVVAICTAIAATLLAAVVTPSATWQYYTSLLWESDRVGFLGGSANQSMNGLLARIAAPHDPSKVIWLLLVVAVAAGAGWRIRRAVQAGDRLAALTLTGLLGILVSPVSWPHHIVWVIPTGVIIAHRLIQLSNTATPDGLPLRTEVWSRLRTSGSLLLLVGLGSLAFGPDLRLALDLPDVDYSDLSVFWMCVASVQMFWCLAAVFLLPIRSGNEAAGSRRFGAETAAPARQN
jgi:alpha-1,2-mannosyltransferase